MIQTFEGDTEINQAAVRCFLQDSERSCNVQVTTQRFPASFAFVHE
jgi:hypothetical protein